LQCQLLPFWVQDLLSLHSLLSIAKRKFYINPYLILIYENTYDRDSAPSAIVNFSQQALQHARTYCRVSYWFFHSDFSLYPHNVVLSSRIVAYCFGLTVYSSCYRSALSILPRILVNRPKKIAKNNMEYLIIKKWNSPPMSTTS
jgi:hypothetical protein